MQPAYVQAATPPLVADRPGWVTASAVVLLAVSVLAGVAGLLLLAMGIFMGPVWVEAFRVQPNAAYFDPEAMSGMVAAFMFVIAGVALGWASATALAGIGILRRREWARITGIVLASIGAVLALLALVMMLVSAVTTSAALSDPQFGQAYGAAYSASTVWAGVVATLAFILPFAIAYLVVLVALIRNAAWFRARPAVGPSSAPAE